MMRLSGVLRRYRIGGSPDHAVVVPETSTRFDRLADDGEGRARDFDLLGQVFSDP